MITSAEPEPAEAEELEDADEAAAEAAADAEAEADAKGEAHEKSVARASVRAPPMKWSSSSSTNTTFTGECYVTMPTFTFLVS